MSSADPVSQFFSEREADIDRMGQDSEFGRKSLEWMLHADHYKYNYNFTWMGRPVIKFPGDMIVQQELMWKLKPDLVIETGIAHGGSLVFSASMMEMMGYEGEVVGIDIDIRPHNREALEAHPLMKRITMYEGSSVDTKIVEKVRQHTVGKRCVMVILDSLHSHEHVYQELRAYGEMVTLGSYCLVTDTYVEFFPKGHFSHNRPWDVGNNPYTGMKQYLSETDLFTTDPVPDRKAVITENTEGYLLRIK
ncbi:CmcI family methyltransferase [Prosthecobacter sp. SYSU 5D2]|uniref:cephalosporin hydroxylase family protein n=1 Tax=Prosthecobacter sp. SYSU 5D2 TaxID=3134134 RepID=UPI0031FEE961